MRQATEIEVTESTMLGCACGERIVLLGSMADWRSEGRDSFECGACGTSVPVPELKMRRQEVVSEEAEPEETSPWVGSRAEPGDDGSTAPSVRKLIQELRAEKLG